MAGAGTALVEIARLVVKLNFEAKSKTLWCDSLHLVKEFVF
jgi:hypothetical protein